MFNLIRKENELSQYMLQLLKLQRGYHESALKNLEKIIPELERKIGTYLIFWKVLEIRWLILQVIVQLGQFSA